MILTVTLNPLLEHRLTYNKVVVGSENRGAKEEYKAGGKGINVSRQLNLLGINNLAFTFLGGNNGKRIKNLLTDEKINFTSTSTHSESRASAIIINEQKGLITSCFGNDPLISNSEAEEFKLKLEKMIQNCEMVVFSGSSPCKETDSIFPFGISTANKYDKISVCDTYGRHLSDCIDAAPTIVHNNLDEVRRSLDKSLENENDMLDHLKYLYTKNVKQVFLTDGANPTFASNLDYIYKVNNPEVNAIDSTGSGDCFTAGIIYGWQKNLPFETMLNFASCLGTVNASRYDVCNVNMDEADNLKNKIELIPLGKKMRLVDVQST